MIHVPFSAPEGFESAIKAPANAAESTWFIFCGNELLVGQDRRTLPESSVCKLQRSLYLGKLKGRFLFAGEASQGSPASSDWIWTPIRSLYTSLDEDDYAIAGRALQLIDWDRTNQYCGECGNATLTREYERCRECKDCGRLYYPKLSLAVLALIRKKNRILLAKSAHFPKPFYSTLAGFVEPGETLEQCVAREVFEEVGIKVTNIQYFGSQPWPLSNSMMIGYFCDWQEGEIKINPHEIEDADWFETTKLPALPPKYSLARFLIDAFSKNAADQK